MNKVTITQHETSSKWCKEQHCSVLIILKTCSIISKCSMVLTVAYVDPPKRQPAYTIATASHAATTIIRVLQ